MFLQSLVAFTVLVLLSFASSADTFQKEILVAPDTRETVVVNTEVPVSFNAQFAKADYLEAEKCGKCLHIETIVQGSKNQAASTIGVGFMLIPPEKGIVSVEVFHDYDSVKAIEVTAEPYKRN